MDSTMVNIRAKKNIYSKTKFAYKRLFLNILFIKSSQKKKINKSLQKIMMWQNKSDCKMRIGKNVCGNKQQRKRKKDQTNS